jgi:hypothetical protein
MTLAFGLLASAAGDRVRNPSGIDPVFRQFCAPTHRISTGKPCRFCVGIIGMRTGGSTERNTGKHRKAVPVSLVSVNVTVKEQ